MKEPNEMSLPQLLEILPHCDEIIAWAKSIKDYCLNEAVKGTKLAGWKIVEGKSIRKWKDEEKVTKTLINLGLKTEDFTESKLMSPTKLEKQVGKAIYAEKLEQYAEKPQGSPTLVKDYDQRQETKTELDLNKIFNK